VGTVLDDILGDLGVRDATARDVRVCLRVTAVRSLRLGLAYTLPREPVAHGDEPEPGAAPLVGRSARELAELARCDDPMRAAVGVAAINSLLEPPAGLVEAHALDVILEHGRDREVTLVGHFPFADRLRERVRALHVLELHPRPGDLPAEAAPRVIPRSDVVALTASTLVNHTLDGLLALARGRTVILIGPTTPLAPALLARGVTALCGSIVVDADAALAAVSEGAGFRRLPGLRRVVLTAARR
jgi:uncharacterized protein (DUF4213/DUF364 family)